MSLTVNVIADPVPQSGEANMRIDAELLDTVSHSDQAFVRVYRWKEPTVSLGYFQKMDELPNQFSSCPSVKRLTGGGAILHDRELTYSLALPATHPFRHAPVSTYVAVHAGIVSLLQSLGVECNMRGEASAQTVSDDPFLCFLRGDPRDVVVGTSKIIGSAQRRRKGCILQHGSILMSHSDLLPEVRGILDFHPGFLTRSFSERLPGVIAEAISCTETGVQPNMADGNPVPDTESS